jgi:hypothetical protein
VAKQTELLLAFYVSYEDKKYVINDIFRETPGRFCNPKRFANHRLETLVQRINATLNLFG